MKKLLYLDIDGVLNDHKPMANGYSQLRKHCVQELCRILDNVPDLKIVLSSAWRYLILNQSMNTQGFEYLLCLFGAEYNTIHNRIIDITVSDEEMCEILEITEKGITPTYEWLKENGELLRREQIYTHAKDNKFLVLDDLDLQMKELIKTHPKIGLTKELAQKVVEYFKEN